METNPSMKKSPILRSKRFPTLPLKRYIKKIETPKNIFLRASRISNTSSSQIPKSSGK